VATDRLAGRVASGFDGVGEAFAANFSELDELGASFAVTVDGHPVVDVWGGVADRATGAPWREDTVGLVFSGTKGLTAFCLLLLTERGLLDPQRPVADYWPAFGDLGKNGILVQHVLAHTAGVPGIRVGLSKDDLLDDRRMAKLVEAEHPVWPAGSTLCYHAFNYGWIAGELVRRVDGRSIGALFADEFAEPLSLETWIGLPDEVLPRVAALSHGASWGAAGPYTLGARPADGAVIRSIIDNPEGRHSAPIMWNEPEFRRTQMPGINGITSARSMARLYSLLAGDGIVDGTRVLTPEAASIASTALSEGIEWVSRDPWKMGFGFQLHGMSPTAAPDLLAVGHGGAGGSVHGAWPELGVSFSYVMNEMRTRPDPRAQLLLDALYDSVISLKAESLDDTAHSQSRSTA
jgi:CubicO group peptidase (beta-lactamase class C family)